MIESRNRRTGWALALAVLAVGCSDGGSNDSDTGAGDTGEGGGPPAVEMTEAFPATDFGWLLSVHGAAANDLYAVGGTPTEGRMMHFDGASWAEVDLGVDVPLLNWVYAFDASHVVVAGDDGTILVYDGATWAVQETPTDQNLWGTWGSAPDDVWAVGGNGKSEGQQTILRYDGTEWKAVEVPPLSKPAAFAFYKVWGSAADDVYVVGKSGVALHWDGAAWEELKLGSSQDFIAVWGTGPDHVIIVGGRSYGVIARKDGDTWLKAEDIGLLPGINGVWARSDDTFYIAAAESTVASVDFDTLEWTDSDYQSELDFHAVFGDAGGRLYSVGGNFLFSQGPYNGVAATGKLP